MRCAIPITNGRIAPRCTYAESLLLVDVSQGQIRAQQTLDMNGYGLISLAKSLEEHRVDTLVCGGISRENKAYLELHNIDIIDNVATTVDDIVDCLREGSLRSGYGLDDNKTETPPDRKKTAKGRPEEIYSIDCLACQNRICLDGKNCLAENYIRRKATEEDRLIAEASMDIACEHERVLCRLSELVYFCLEMKYRKIGVAFCNDLLEPTEILVRVLRRFFDVSPVSCKIGGISLTDPYGSETQDNRRWGDRQHIACNPIGQAEALNRLQTDLNVLVGICMGADCVFTRYSEAPVTTLFVKDKSLANNPIGAVYSDYYIKEATRASVNRT